MIVTVLGTAGCRQILGIDQGTVRSDGGADASGDDAATIDAGPDAGSDAAVRLWMDPVLVPGLAAGDEDPTLPSDMTEMYFTRGTDIYVTTRTIIGGWSTPQKATFSSVDFPDEAPEISPDGLQLAFASSRGPGGSTLDIYFTTRATRTTAWSQPALVANVNRSDADDRPGSMSASGTHLTLSSDRDANTGVDLFEATRASAFATFQTPVRIPLSTDGGDGAPFLTNDGLTLYYATSPAGSLVRDLYVATRASDTDAFTAGARIDDLSTPANDSDPWVSPDGTEIYFASDRDGANRIWYARRVP